MSHSEPITDLDLPIPTLDELPDDTRRYFEKCQSKLGLVPNVIKAYSQNIFQLEAFTRMYNELMLGESELEPLEREMVAVVVSSENKCFYCLTAHGAAVRQYSGNPELGEQLVMNYRAAELSARQRAMLDFASALTRFPDDVTDEDRDTLRAVGLSDRAIWDLSNLIGFYNMTNRVATASGMRPNPEYHGQSRS